MPTAPIPHSGPDPDSDLRSIALFGAGGHAKVVAEVAQLAGFVIETVLVDYTLPDQPGQRQPIAPMVTWAEFLSKRNQFPFTRIALAVGKNDARKEIAARLEDAGLELQTLIHPSAAVSRTAAIGPGTVVMPLAVVNAHAIIGRGAIINSGAIVEHDCHIGDFAHLSPNAALGGNAIVGDGAHLGLNACVLPGVKVGTRARVGAGAVVVRDVPEGVTVVGIPARAVGAQ
jgi:sugar O-acyltransferase (sialic acid O-acetyltransferase NeuD family)